MKENNEELEFQALRKSAACKGCLYQPRTGALASGGLRLPAAVSPEPGNSSVCVRSGKRLPAAGGTGITGLTSGEARPAFAVGSPPSHREPESAPILHWAAGFKRVLDRGALIGSPGDAPPRSSCPRRLAATAQTRTQSRADLGSPPRSQARLSSPESCGDPGLPGTGAGRSRIPSEGEIPEFPPAAPILPGQHGPQGARPARQCARFPFLFRCL